MTLVADPSADTPRRRLTSQDVRRRSLRVKFVRIAFLAAAAFSTLLLVGSIIFRAVQTAAIDTSKLVQGDDYVMDAPKFVGRTKDGKKLTVTGLKATRSVSRPDGPVKLQKPRLETSDGSIATAAVGVWSQEGQELTLSGDVVFERKSGEKAVGTNAVWTSDPSVLKLEGGTKITLPSGENATADALTWDERDRSVALNGSVLVTFKGGTAASQSAYFDSQSKRLVGSGATQVRSGLGIGSADRYEYNTASKSLRMSGNVRATLN